MKICKLELSNIGFDEVELEGVAEVRFRIDKNTYIDISISDIDSLEVRSNSLSAFDRLAICPATSNQIYLKIIKQEHTKK